MKRFVTFLIITIILSIASTHTANADTNCQSIYGGGENCGSGNITVQKQVLNPVTNKYVNNLGTNDPAYSPLSPIFFKVMVKNNGTTPITNIVVKDNIDDSHEFLDFVSVN